MNNELDTILRMLEKERGISRSQMLKTIEDALAAAAKKSYLTSDDVHVVVDPRTLAIRAFERRTVDDSVHGTAYISLEAARKVNPDAQIGDTVETPVDPRVFGRIAAQTAKQAILQGIHNNERDIMQKRYENQVGKVVYATVRQISHRDVICDLREGGEAILKSRDRMKSDRFQPMDEFRAVIRCVGPEKDPRRSDDEAGFGRSRAMKLVDEPANNPCVKLSRTDKSFLKALFVEQSAEIKDGDVEIVAISRQPGVRSKIAVRSQKKNIDPIGACVGQRGSRIRPIINELGGEKIDIVAWSDDIETFAVSALSPAEIRRIEADREARTIVAYVDKGGLTPAIGKGGINTRLAAELVGWDISVRELTEDGETEDQKRIREEQFLKDYNDKVAALAATVGISVEAASIVANHGFLTPEGIIELLRADFCAELTNAGPDGDLPTLSAEEAQTVWDTAEELILNRTADPSTPSA